MATTAELFTGFCKAHGDDVGSFGGTLMEVPRIPTGFFAFDLASGGGLPKGRVSIIVGPESSCKSNLALRAIANHQRLWPDQTNVFFDLEHTLDPGWARALGVDTDKLLVLEPSYAEQCVDMIDGLLETDDIGMVVLDSVAAMASTAEIEKETEKSNMGVSGNVMSKLVKKSTHTMGQARKKGGSGTLIYVNQVRTKLGVVFGDPECLHGDTPINFVDGRHLTIREVVEQKLDGPIWAFDETNGSFVQARILSHHYNGQAKDGEFLTVTSEALDTKNGVLSATVSVTHKFFTDSGWKQARELTTEDKLLTRYRSVIGGSLRKFLTGALCGDTSIERQGDRARRVGLRFSDRNDPDYAMWKWKLLAPYFGGRSDVSGLRIPAATELSYFVENFGGCRHPAPLFADFSWLAFAIWMLDDGNYCRGRYTLAIGRFRTKPDVRAWISARLNDLGLSHRWHQDKNVVFSTAVSAYIAEKIAEFVPPCMHRKLPEHLRGVGLTELQGKDSQVPSWVTITSIVQSSPRKYRERGLYDIHVEGHHNYLAGNVDNGFVVHNTMPGGMAQKFQASMIVRLYGKNIVDPKIHKTMPIAKNVKAVIKKWKVPILAVGAEFEMVTYPHKGLGVGETDDWSVVSEYLKTFGQIEKQKDGYLMLGESYPTQKAMQERFYTDHKFSDDIRSALIQRLLEDPNLVLELK